MCFWGEPNTKYYYQEEVIPSRPRRHHHHHHHHGHHHHHSARASYGNIAMRPAVSSVPRVMRPAGETVAVRY